MLTSGAFAFDEISHEGVQDCVPPLVESEEAFNGLDHSSSIISLSIILT
jgi:hypothetical protein